MAKFVPGLHWLCKPPRDCFILTFPRTSLLRPYMAKPGMVINVRMIPAEGKISYHILTQVGQSMPPGAIYQLSYLLRSSLRRKRNDIDSKPVLPQLLFFANFSSIFELIRDF